MSKEYAFLIDTDQYSGNFERQMCAYMTGILGECFVGSEMVEIYVKEFGDDDRFDCLASHPDDNGCWRPVAIYPTPGWSNDGYGHYSKGPGPYPAYQSVGIFMDRPPVAKGCRVSETEGQSILSP